MNKKYLIDNLVQDSKIVSTIKKYKNEIKQGTISLKNIENRSHNFLYLSDKITYNVYNLLGDKYLYEMLLKDGNGTNYEELEEDEFNNIWWFMLDLVEDYILKVVEEREKLKYD